MSSLAPLLIALGDDELIIGHRHSEWTGWAPHIEEDVAFSSIAQDEIGHAAAYYSLAGELTGQSADEIAFGRAPEQYRNALICERPNGDWAYTLVRHWLYDHADEIRLETLEGSSNPQLAGLATKIRREERYHLLHADMWMKRLAAGPVEGRTNVIHALNEAYSDSLGLFEAVEFEDDALSEGLLTVPAAELKERFVAGLAEALDELGLPAIAPDIDHGAEFVASSSGDLIEGEGSSGGTERPEGIGGRGGEHTDDFKKLWEVMTTHHREEPEATW